MQSRLAASMSIATARNRLSWLRASTTKGRTANPTVHAGELEGVDADEAAKAKMAEEEQKEKLPIRSSGKVIDGIPPFKTTPPYTSTPKLESTSVNTPLDPTIQQKRHYSDATLKDVSCTADVVDAWTSSRGRDEPRVQEDEPRVQEEEDKAYFMDHKASPLSNVKIADTRKPLEKAWDRHKGKEGGEVLTFKEEQMESAEETLMRVARLWKMQATRGLPDYPHSRVLRAILRDRGDYSLEEEEFDTL